MQKRARLQYRTFATQPARSYRLIGMASRDKEVMHGTPSVTSVGYEVCGLQNGGETEVDVPYINLRAKLKCS